MTSPRIHPQPVDYLLTALARALVANRKLRAENRRLRKSRDRWRAEAKAWKWGALR
jgi:hypothetical protein